MLFAVKEKKEAIELEQLSLENAKENLEIANKSYDAGVASNTDVIDAQSTYNQAKINLLQSEYSYE
ncbi:TolC family protein, partial [Salmonella enterica subsp. enterica serovar Enteritidis]|uniref:TolC family protein n=1 Tax=Salmonella enterica TaxID=28901 RepID=UPI0039E95BDD